MGKVRAFVARLHAIAEEAWASVRLGNTVENGRYEFLQVKVCQVWRHWIMNTGRAKEQFLCKFQEDVQNHHLPITKVNSRPNFDVKDFVNHPVTFLPLS